MNKTLFLPLIILFFALYYFVFPWESSNEIVWTAEYCEPFEGLDPSSPPLSDIVIINQGNFKAVLGSEAKESFISESGFRGSLSSTHAFYKEDDTLYLKEFGAYSFAVAKTDSSPLVLEDRFFSVNYGSSFIEEFNQSGSLLWSWKGLAPLTAMACNKDYTAIGSLDGTVSLVDKSGQITSFPIYPIDDNVIYSVAISDDSSRVAIISGLRNQYLRTYTFSDSPQLLSQIKLKSQYRRPVKMYYSEDAATLWVEQENGLIQFTDDNPALLIPVEDIFLTMRHDKEESLIYILSKNIADENKVLYSLKCYSPEGQLLLKNTSEYYPSSFQLSSANVLFSIDENIMILNREEM